MARILIVGGGCPGRRLAAQLVEQDHAVRVTTRDERARAEIERSGAECWIGTPDRLATMRGALDHVTVACWMLAGAHGERETLRALHGSRLEFFLTQAIDTTVRGFLYDATPRADRPEAVGPQLLAEGAAIVRRIAALNAIPAVVLAGGDVGGDGEATPWLAAAAGAIEDLLAGRVRSLVERG
ncbi:MAG TPA: hypothetical protein VGX69_12125 [Solirubrobacteraceae bacterium]|nr:hypothetical protein [Solirubrobacteraceae bacterium]